MHKIFDLREMDVEKLRVLAEELGVKGFKKMEKEDLVYAVLDEEAKQNALKTPETKEKRKRGRPRKDQAQKQEGEIPSLEGHDVVDQQGQGKKGEEEYGGGKDHGKNPFVGLREIRQTGPRSPGLRPLRP